MPTRNATAAATIVVDPGSFRDPSGFVYRRDGRLLRQVDRSFEKSWSALRASGLLASLQARSLLIGHQDVDAALAADPSSPVAVIEPQTIPLISYPYEWSFEELKDAALLTLEAQAVAAASRFSMRDASAYNVQFRDGRPILIDTLSFEPADPDAPWVGYRQFCEHFLAPLVLMAHRDVRCGLLLREFIDGIPLELAATLLPGRTKLDLGVASHVHAHALAQRRAERARASPIGRARMTALKLAALVDSLRRTVEKLSWQPGGAGWSKYADHTSYSDRAARSKDATVTRMLRDAGGSTVWDLGANKGRFSAIAASLGRQVIAWDADAGATDLHYRSLKADGSTAILPLVLDLGNPSPAIGWAGAERRSFFQRAGTDTVLALALVHHLAIGRNVPFAMIADVFADLGPNLVVEFVPKSDPMVQEMLAYREDIFPDYTLSGFRATFESRFAVVDEARVEESDRVLLRMRRR